MRGAMHFRDNSNGRRTVCLLHVVFKGINAKSEILKRKRKVEGRGRGRERKRKGKKEEGKGEREIGSEALAETEKIANTPAENRTRDPSKRG